MHGLLLVYVTAAVVARERATKRHGRVEGEAELGGLDVTFSTPLAASPAPRFLVSVPSESWSARVASLRGEACDRESFGWPPVMSMVIPPKVHEAFTHLFAITPRLSVGKRRARPGGIRARSWPSQVAVSCFPSTDSHGSIGAF